MDENLTREIVAAAAGEVMLDADKRYAEWLAARSDKVRAAKDLAGAGFDPSADLFALLTVLVETAWSFRGDVATNFVTGVLTYFATDWLKPRAPRGLTEVDIQAIAATVEAKIEAAFRAQMPPDPGEGHGPPTA